MRGRLIALLAGALAIGLVQVGSAATDITGKWTAKFDTQVGEQSYTYEFQVKGSALTGKAESNLGKAEIKNGKVDGDTVTFTEILNFQDMTLEIAYTGKIVSADQIDFTRVVAAADATEKLVAKRVK